MTPIVGLFILSSSLIAFRIPRHPRLSRAPSSSRRVRASRLSQPRHSPPRKVPALQFCPISNIGASTLVPNESPVRVGTAPFPAVSPAVADQECVESSRVAAWPLQSHGIRRRRKEGREVVFRLGRRLDQPLGRKPQCNSNTKRSAAASPVKPGRSCHEPVLRPKPGALSSRLPSSGCKMVPCGRRKYRYFG